MDGYTREQFLERIKLKSELRDVRGMGKIPIRQFSHNELSQYNEMRSSDDLGIRREAPLWLIKQCVLDKPYGSPVLTDDDISSLGVQGDGLTVDRLLGELLRFSDADPEAVARAGEASAETRGSASESDSPSPSASPQES